MNRDVLVAGETLVDFIPDSVGPIPDVETFHRRAGGAPANVAVGLARLSDAPLFWTRVGDDAFGDYLAETLDEEGIPDRFVERDAGAKTSLAFVSHDPDADRSFSFYRDGTADTRLQSGTVPTETLADAEWVHVGGVTLADDPSRSATIDLLERAQEENCTVSFDPNARPELWSNDAEFETVCGWALELADVVKATPEELRALGLAGEDATELARAALERGPHTVFQTLGPDGSMAVADESAPWSGEASHDGYPVDPVDTTGAGDAFTAGAITACRRSDPSLDDALAFANAVAAETTTGQGAMTSLPERDAVEAVLERHSADASDGSA